MKKATLLTALLLTAFAYGQQYDTVTIKDRDKPTTRKQIDVQFEQKGGFLLIENSNVTPLKRFKVKKDGTLVNTYRLNPKYLRFSTKKVGDKLILTNKHLKITYN